MKQLAPARVSRGMLLPEVRTFGDQLKPYVICSKHPSGAVSVALLPRVTVESGIIHTKAEVELQLEEIIDIPVGIFGQLDRLIIHFKQLITSPFEVWAQDLAKEEAINITDQISLESQSLIIPGGLVDELCGGSHLPGVVVKLILI
ncbi:MAG: hypothetical protein H7X86_10505 [Gorillibacterium sp.]|nr:hypothetical protein [Gorillibacterium sp.]